MMNSKMNVRQLTITALMTAVLCVLGPIALPIGPVPVSLTNLALYFMVYIVGYKITSVAYLVYMLLGLAGLPVFSAYQGGAQKLFGPTGGYIIGFLPMIVIIGIFVQKYWRKQAACVAVMEAATWIPYLMGTAWLSVSTGMSFGAALAVGVLPFAFEDLLKMIAAAMLGPILRRRLDKAGVLPG